MNTGSLLLPDDKIFFEEFEFGEYLEPPFEFDSLINQDLDLFADNLFASTSDSTFQITNSSDISEGTRSTNEQSNYLFEIDNKDSENVFSNGNTQNIPYDISNYQFCKPDLIRKNSEQASCLTANVDGAKICVHSTPPLNEDTSNSQKQFKNIAVKTAATKPVLPKNSIFQHSANQSSQHTAKTYLKRQRMIDDKVLVKQLRMIRNRESASLSRKKEKEYITSLENKVTTLEKENIQLKQENNQLKHQLTNTLRNCHCHPQELCDKSKFISHSIKKNTTVLLAMIFMVSLNFGKFQDFIVPNITQPHKLHYVENNTNNVFGRKLLWLNDTSIVDEYQTNSNYPCPSNINQTENLRLTTELKKLVDVQQYLNITSSDETLDLSTPNINIKSSKNFPKYFIGRKNFSSINNMRKKRMIFEEHSIQMFMPKRTKYWQLFKKMQKRDDTFYVLSFNYNQILLPPVAYDKTSRPKMSLMMPTGDILPNGQISLTQIDCEVLNTSTIHLSGKHIRSPLRSHLKYMYKSKSETNATFKVKSNENTNNSLLGTYNKSKAYQPYFVKTHPDQKENSTIHSSFDSFLP